MTVSPIHQSSERMNGSENSPFLQSSRRMNEKICPPVALEELFDDDYSSEDPFKPSTTDPPRVWLSPNSEKYLLASLDCSELPVYSRPTSDGKDSTVKGGEVDALIVEATRASKKDFAHQEAFVTTYRPL